MGCEVVTVDRLGTIWVAPTAGKRRKRGRREKERKEGGREEGGRRRKEGRGVSEYLVMLICQSVFKNI